MKRKSLHISLIALAIGLGASAGIARANDEVRLRLNWMYYGSHAGFAYGLDKGYYKEQGIDLDIRSGNGSGSAHRLVANKDSTFSYGSCASMVNLAAGGAPLISVGVIDAMGTDAVIVRPDTGVKSLAGLKEGDVSITNVPDGALVSSYLQGAGGAVGMLGGLDDKPAEIKAAGGAAPVTFAYSDFGVNQVGYCIVTTKDTVAKNPDLVKRFMAATIKAYKETAANPDAAI